MWKLKKIEIEYLSKNKKGFSIEDITKKTLTNIFFPKKEELYFINSKKNKIIVGIELMISPWKNEYYDVWFYNQDKVSDNIFFNVMNYDREGNDSLFKTLKRRLKEKMLESWFKEKYKNVTNSYLDNYDLEMPKTNKEKEEISRQMQLDLIEFNLV